MTLVELAGLVISGGGIAAVSSVATKWIDRRKAANDNDAAVVVAHVTADAAVLPHVLDRLKAIEDKSDRQAEHIVECEQRNDQCEQRSKQLSERIDQLDERIAERDEVITSLQSELQSVANRRDEDITRRVRLEVRRSLSPNCDTPIVGEESD